MQIMKCEENLAHMLWAAREGDFTFSLLCLSLAYPGNLSFKFRNLLLNICLEVCTALKGLNHFTPGDNTAVQ